MAAAKKSQRLLALTSAALALPGLASKAQAAVPPPMQADYRFSYYSEDDLPQSKNAGSDGERYAIKTQQIHFQQPFAGEYGIDVQLLHETMSGASPWYITPGANGPVQVMSGATIEETRNDVSVALSRYLQDMRFGATLGFSDENDYRSLHVAVDGEWEQTAQRSWSAGLGYSSDKLEPTDAGSTRFPNRIAKADKDSLTVFAGVTQVLDPLTTLSGSVTYTRLDGFLSDPYKRVFVANNLANDSRPDGKQEWVGLLRLRRHFPAIRGTLHVDYRYYHNDWEIDAHTLDAAWYQHLGDHWMLIPGLRYYSQSQAFFYHVYYNTPRSDGFASSDYRLSPYGAISYRIRLGRDLGNWRVHLGYERYNSDADLAIKKVSVENPGLVDFDVISVGFSYRFE